MTDPLPQLPHPEATSESEEMYLITVARAVEDGTQGMIPIAALAADLRVSVASANEMVRKLATRDLLVYEPYRGVQLTELGTQVSERVLRTRRLWATFLADHLGFSPGDADDQACLLEHVTLPAATDRLASFLGDPDHGPLGRPIPHGGAAPPGPPLMRLTDLEAGARVEVLEITGTQAERSFFGGEGIEVGKALVVEAKGSAGMLVGTGTSLVHLSSETASRIVVGPA